MTISPKTREYAKSILLSFLTGFGLVILAQIDTITLASLQDGTVAGLIVAAFRTGLKLSLQFALKGKV